jgi:histone deacetylase HOS3
MDPVLIANASVNISGGGGSQFVTNVHLEPYDSLDDFHDTLYPAYRDSLLEAADAFLRKTSAVPEQTLVLISAGFDACEHEYPAMSRHGAKVPVSFFTRFAQDASIFAEKHALGRLLAVLEGGYSQRALSTGVGAFRKLADPHPLRI